MQVITTACAMAAIFVLFLWAVLGLLDPNRCQSMPRATTIC
jgi:hypothetical protein